MKTINYKWWRISKLDLNKKIENYIEDFWTQPTDGVKHQVENIISINWVSQNIDNLANYFKTPEHNNIWFLNLLDESIEKKDFNQIHTCISMLKYLMPNDRNFWSYERLLLHRLVDHAAITEWIKEWKELKYWWFSLGAWVHWFQYSHGNAEKGQGVWYTFEPQNFIYEFIDWSNDTISLDDNWDWEWTNINNYVDLDKWDLPKSLDWCIMDLVKYDWDLYLLRSSESGKSYYVMKLTNDWDKMIWEYLNLDIKRIPREWYISATEFTIDTTKSEKSIIETFNEVKFDSCYVPNKELYNLMKKLNPKIWENTADKFQPIAGYWESLLIKGTAVWIEDDWRANEMDELLKLMWVPKNQIKLFRTYNMFYNIEKIGTTEIHISHMKNPDYNGVIIDYIPIEYRYSIDIKTWHRPNYELFEYKENLYETIINWKKYYSNWHLTFTLEEDSKDTKFVYIDENENIIEDYWVFLPIVMEKILKEITDPTLIKLIEWSRLMNQLKD